MTDDAKNFCRERGLACQESDGKGPATEQLAQAARRLALLATVLTATVVVILMTGFALHEGRGLEVPQRLWLDRARHAALLVLSLGVIGAVHLLRLPPKQVTNLGAAFQLLGSLVMSISFFAVEPALQSTPSLLTWLGVWIILFPLVAPAAPLRTALQALASAATAPLVFAAGTLARGDAWPATQVLVGTFLPYLVCAGQAVAASIIINGFARDAKKAAREARDLGSYRLVEKIGMGGMGEVWRAEHRLLARPAAVKLIRPKADADELQEALRRFEREARATSRLRSPNTVSLYDYGVVEDGTAYYAMELLEGIDLEDLVRVHGPLPAGRAIHLIVQAAESLAEAHHDGLVHRDIKPANLFLARLGVAVDVLKVMDFGLVALGPRAQASAKLTNPGFILGTPAYMAPEAVTSAESIDARSDIYALGCVLYWLLTGNAVFDDPSPMRLLIDHARTAPTPPRLRNPSIPADLEALVLACLAKDPADRPQTALELRARLLACASAGSWTAGDAHAWWSKHLPQLAPGISMQSSASARRETAASVVSS
jgi:serine/threonine-protein kinase